MLSRFNKKFLSVIKADGSEGQAGQVLVIGLLVALGLAMVAFTVANVGLMVAEKIHVQDTADAAAYSSAVVEARYMNLSAYINRAIVANYNTMAFDTALWATVMGHDHGLAVAAAVVYIIATLLTVTPFAALAPEVDMVADGIAAVHSPLHSLDKELKSLFSQAEDTKFNKYIEMINTDFLSMYQGILYAAMQSSRYNIAQEVAQKMDKEIKTSTILGLGAETVSADELAAAMDYIIDDPDKSGGVTSFSSSFNKMMGKDTDHEDDHIVLLGAVTEASLDKFTAGRTREGKKDTLRNFGLQNLIPSWIVSIIAIAEEASCWADCTYHPWSCSCGSQNFDMSIVLGADIREQRENKASETHVPFIANRRMREANFFGIRMNNPVGGNMGAISDAGSSFSLGYSSSHKKGDVEIQANDPTHELKDFDAIRFGQCMMADGCKMNMLNIMMGDFFGALVWDADEHWDGTFDTEPVDFASLYPPGAYKIPLYMLDGFPDRWDPGVQRYDWKIDLNNVGFPTYHYDAANAEKRIDGNAQDGDVGNPNDNNVFTGPSLGIVAIKKKEDVNGLRGLGLGNEYAITAVSRSQVYYLRNPKRPDELPSSFNPHWVARLAPLDSDGTPIVLREGLPFLGSKGVPIKPTH